MLMAHFKWTIKYRRVLDWDSFASSILEARVRQSAALLTAQPRTATANLIII